VANVFRQGGPLLSVTDLAIEFASDTGPRRVLEGMSIEVSAGRTVALVGESGSGKSVTAQAIMGILPKNAKIVGGSILFRDPQAGGAAVDIAALDREGSQMRALRGARMAMIFQEPMTSLSPVHTVGNQVTEALRLHARVGRKEALDRARAVFERVGFPDPNRALGTYPFELSGGMRQRAMIAMALICRPALLIADEPTTALDVTTQAQILELMLELKREEGMAILLITHDLGVVANVADDVVVLYRGRVMEAGARDEIFRAPRHPYLKALLHAVPHLDMKPGERLVPIRPVKAQPELALRQGIAAVPDQEGRTVLHVEHVTKTYPRRVSLFGKPAPGVTAVWDVSLALKTGRTVGLVGESGCGKSTLARMIMRAAAPTQGQILYDDGSGPKDVYALDDGALKAYRRAVQLVFQDPYSSLNPRMTVYEILSEPLKIHNVGSRDERFERVKALLEMVGLDVKALRRYPHAFSGGQRQRLGIARALALGPRVLICDEPVSALDVSVQAQVLNLFKDLQKALGLASLFVSHNLAVVDYVSDEIAVMCRGHLVETAPGSVLFRNPVHPYTKALLAAVPTPDLSHPLDFKKLRAEGFSDPARWPEPFTIATMDQRPTMIEVEAGHCVRMNEAAVELRKAS